MTEQTGSAEAGNLGGAAALIAGDGGGGDTLAGSQGTDTLTGSAAPEWLSGLTDDDSRSFAQTKGWKSPSEMLTSYRSLEALLGGEKLPLPKDEGDAEGYERVYKALGKPETPEGYQIKAPEGVDPAFAGEASKWFHEAGLSAKQGAALAEKWNAHVTAAIEAENQAFKTKSGQDLGELKTVWGDKFNSNVELARRAGAQFGLSPQDIASMERAIGTKRLMETLQKIGAGLGEHGFEAGDTKGGGFRLTPEAARARIDTLKADKAWSTRYLNGDADAKAEMNRLQQAAYPERA
jgi:hypothetical protein